MTRAAGVALVGCGSAYVREFGMTRAAGVALVGCGNAYVREFGMTRAPGVAPVGYCSEYFPEFGMTRGTVPALVVGVKAKKIENVHCSSGSLKWYV